MIHSASAIISRESVVAVFNTAPPGKLVRMFFATALIEPRSMARASVDIDSGFVEKSGDLRRIDKCKVSFAGSVMDRATLVMAMVGGERLSFRVHLLLPLNAVCFIRHDVIVPGAKRINQMRVDAP
jgi:hypothetical protein